MKSKTISERKRRVLLAVYFVVYLFLFQFIILNFIYEKYGFTGYLICDALMNAFMLILFVFVLYDWLGDQWHTFCEKPWDSVKNIVLYVLMLFGVTILFNLLFVSPFNLSEAENQMNNDAYMGMNLFGFLLNAIFMAPFIEEIIFRGCIFHPAAKKWGMLAGALLSGVIFGGLHIAASMTSGNWINLLYIIDYGMCGVVLSYAFGRSDSIWTSVFVHAVFNLLGVLAMFH